MTQETETSDDQSTIDVNQRSQLQQFWKQYRKNKLSLAGGVLVVLLLITALFAPVIAPHSPYTQFDVPEDEQYHPLPPGSEITLTDRNEEVVKQSTAYFGTDNVGRDILSRALFGMRLTLMIGLSVIMFAMVIGAVAGGIAGYYYETWIDDSIMRFMDMLFPFPSLILAVALLGVVGIGETTYELAVVGEVVVPNVAKIVLVITIVYIPRFARVMRGAVLKEIEEDYVDAAKSIGASDSHILLRDISMNTIPPVIIQATLYIGTAVLISAGLSFLGLGIQPPEPSLGVMLARARNYIHSGEWWFAAFPGLGIFLIILAFNLLGDGLRDALDPRYQGEQ
jgi:ABC-type dipeptide/oligopeptide/nickel transport system permease subunit